MKRVLLEVFIILLFVSTAEAGLTVEDYSRGKTQAWFKVYIGGIGQGITIANDWLKLEKKPSIFCIANDRILNAEDYISLIDAYLVKNKDILTLDTPISVVLLFALKEAYPCAQVNYKRQ